MQCLGDFVCLVNVVVVVVMLLLLAAVLVTTLMVLMKLVVLVEMPRLVLFGVVVVVFDHDDCWSVGELEVVVAN